MGISGFSWHYSTDIQKVDGDNGTLLTNNLTASIICVFVCFSSENQEHNISGYFTMLTLNSNELIYEKEF